MTGLRPSLKCALLWKKFSAKAVLPDGGASTLSGLQLYSCFVGLISVAPSGKFSSYLSQQLVLLTRFSATIINNLNR
ncbi:hypothetical protein CI104_06650 [Citrobacter farmeri]|uniref:Uncharacterized protein n=1 Tax=Citrobacter farmeri TaxID=67824 RepID=A0ACA8D3N7_9ENTR|nr:hypothetical protein CI104_06650 [Citrobacter farmeri]RSB16662.1 hypothetical protein EGK65_13265 [Citrobacter farmeri]